MKRALAVCVVLGWVAVSAFAAPMISNPSFEAVQITSPFSSSNPADVPGWTHSGDVGDALLWGIGYSDGGGNVTVAGAGNQFVTLGGGFNVSGSASWQTTITGLTPGANYQLGFEIANECERPSEALTAAVSNGATGGGTFTTVLNAGCYWKAWEQQFLSISATGSSATLTFSVTNQPFDMGLDNITISSSSIVPEPGTALLLGSGIVGLASVLRSKVKL